MKIIKAGTYGFHDVFCGSGWKNHTRVRWDGKKKVLQWIAGRHLPAHLLSEIKTTLLKG